MIVPRVVDQEHRRSAKVEEREEVESQFSQLLRKNPNERSCIPLTLSNEYADLVKTTFHKLLHILSNDLHPTFVSHSSQV